jgi:L-fucose/D-arabinose isomerase
MIGHKLPVVTGIITLIDPREEFYTNFLETRGMDLREQYSFNHESALDLTVGEQVLDLGIIDSREALNRICDKLASAGLDLLIINMPGWAPPGWGGLLYIKTGIPILINASFALSGPMAMRGELTSLGAETVISFGDPTVANDLFEEVRARKLASSLKGIRAARIGGFSMGMHYAEPGPANTLKDFGIELEPVDGSRVLLDADNLSSKRVNSFLENLKASVGSFPQEPSEFLERQVRYYLALKDLVDQEDYAFLSVQCQPEFSDCHGTLCIAISFLSAPADPEGDKKITPVSCEGDFYAALGCYLLYLLSGQSPFFGDLIMPFYDENTIALQNCGGASVWHACQSSSLTENLAKISVVRNLQGKTESYALDFTGPAAPEATLLGLGQTRDAYWLAAERVELLERKDLKPLIMEWPTLFIKAPDARAMLNRLYSQHIALVSGDYHAVLEKYGNLLKRSV